MSRRMKDSGIEWIGEIPEDWEIVKVKDAFNRKNNKANTENPVILSLARSGIKIRDISNNEGQLASDYSNYNPVDIDDLLLNPMDLISGDNCNISRVKGVISPAYINLRYKKGTNPELYNLYFKNLYWRNVFFAHGKGVSFENRWTLSYETLSQMKIPYPTIGEQNMIAKFLINKLDSLESVKNTINQEIKTLEDYKKSIITEAVTKGLDKNVEMKDSGIEWVGEIPKKWKINKIGRICEVITDFVASGSFASLAKNVTYLDSEDYAMLVRTVDLSNKRDNVNRIYINKSSYEFLRNSNLKGGEIVLPNIGASIGDVYLVPKLYERMSLAPNSIMIKTKYIDKYYYYCFSSKYGQILLKNLSISSAQPKFNKTELRNIKMMQPSIKEQALIVNYLDQKCQLIDDSISIKKQQLETLEEYKKSLIYEYVTGKKEVKDV